MGVCTVARQFITCYITHRLKITTFNMKCGLPLNKMFRETERIKKSKSHLELWHQEETAELMLEIVRWSDTTPKQSYLLPNS